MKVEAQADFWTQDDNEVSRRLLRGVIDRLFAFVSLLDSEGRVIEANRAPLEAANMMRADVLGQYFWDCPWWTWSQAARERLRASVLRAAKGETLRYDATIEVAAGARITLDFQLAPLKTTDGKVTCIVASGTDISWRKNTERELQNAVVRTDLALKAGHTGIWETDLQSGEIIWDIPMRALFGLLPNMPVTQSILDGMINPEDLLQARLAAAAATDPKGDGEYDAEFRLVQTEAHAQERWIVARGRCIFENGVPVRMIGIARDTSERKQREAHVHMLMREIAHRSKNLLAVIQAMARQTATGGGSAKDFETRFTARLEALAGSQDLLMVQDWHGASLKDLIQSQLVHFADLIGSRIHVEGPDLMLKPEAAQNIGLALHELSTNAAKYGALSTAAGMVHLSWTIRRDPRHPLLSMTWRETDGPPVTPPKSEGFGHKVLQRIAAHALEGKVKLDFAPDGLVWQLEIPTSYLVHGRKPPATDNDHLKALDAAMRGSS